MKIEIYTDGACSGNGKIENFGAYGFIVVENNEIIDKFTERLNNTTNQRCEMLGILSAYKYCEKNKYNDVTIYTDSAYCYNAKRDKWYVNWQKNGWKTSKKEPVKNKDLWEELIPFFNEISFSLEKVKGHEDNYFNNQIDELVVTTRKTNINYLKGQKFGRLTVLQLWETTSQSSGQYLKWLCECECGNKKIIDSGNLMSGVTKSCGCLKKENCSIATTEDLIGQRFGKLIAIKREGSTIDRYAKWYCQCDCGGNTTVSSRILKNGSSQSCGCIKSLGEEKISILLNEKKIIFQKEYSFNNLLSESKRRLRFDFAIIKNEKLLCLIEYQGKQHFEDSNSGWNTGEKLIKTIEHDNLKVDYCFKNNILLYIITYLDDIEEKINELVDQLAIGKIAPESIK